VRYAASFLGAISLYLGILFVYLGFVATTCTMCDTDSLVVGMVLSIPVYLLASILIYSSCMTIFSAVLYIPAVVFFLYQAFIGSQLVYVVNVLRGCGCAVTQGYAIEGNFGQSPDLWVSLTGPWFLVSALVLLLQIGVQFYRCLQEIRRAL